MSKPLTVETIMIRTKCDKLNVIKNLNLWGSDIEDISCVASVPNLEVISFAVNKIKTLKPFSKLAYLRELYLRKNNISNIKEINHLRDCFSLKTLSLNENPICDNPNYRQIVIKALPQLIKLDDKVISAEERNSTECDDDDEEEENNDYAIERISKKKSDNNIGHNQLKSQYDMVENSVNKQYNHQKSEIVTDRYNKGKRKEDNFIVEKENEEYFKHNNKENRAFTKRHTDDDIIVTNTNKVNKKNQYTDTSNESPQIASNSNKRRVKEVETADNESIVLAIELLIGKLTKSELFELKIKINERINKMNDDEY